MPGSRVPREVSVFLRDHVQSITQLDLLLLLHGAAGRPWTAAHVAAELRVPERFVTGQLVDLARAGVLTGGDDEPPTWRIDRSGPYTAVVDELADVVRRRKRAVQDLILSAPSSDVQLFSDAFRLRRKDD